MVAAGDDEEVSLLSEALEIEEINRIKRTVQTDWNVRMQMPGGMPGYFIARKYCLKRWSAAPHPFCGQMGSRQEGGEGT